MNEAQFVSLGISTIGSIKVLRILGAYRRVPLILTTGLDRCTPSGIHILP